MNNQEPLAFKVFNQVIVLEPANVLPVLLVVLLLLLSFNVRASVGYEVSQCWNCSSESAFESSARLRAYDLVPGLSPGTYYPHILVVDFDSSQVRKYEVRLDVYSSSSEPFQTIPNASASINQELVVESGIVQDVANAKMVRDALNDILDSTAKCNG